MKIIKWFKYTFIKRCKKQPKWDLVKIHRCGLLDVQCKECGKIREKVYE